jgi:hypothetical protein
LIVRKRALLGISLLVAAGAVPAQSVLTRGEQLSVDVAPSSGELVFNLVGDLWTVAAQGGVASRLAESPYPADRPRWSPDGRRIVFEAPAPDGDALWLVDAESGSRRRIATAGTSEREPAWHPSGERIVYASGRNGVDFDLWEQDLATGLEWRLTSDPADEREPSWSSDGRDLAYVVRRDDHWTLMLKRFAEAPVELVVSETPVRAPSWRPDGTLITFFRENAGRHELRMVILSDPPLERVLGDEPGLFPRPVAWRDRSRFYYSAGDQLRTRGFDEWNGSGLTFRASLGPSSTAPTFRVAERELPLLTPPTDRLVIRAGRIFDGYSATYRYGADVLLEDGLIADVTAIRDWGDVAIVELPTTTMLPGFVDAYGRLPRSRQLERGAELLAWGVTTIVAEPPDGFDGASWETEATPGPRLLPAAQLTELAEEPSVEHPETPFLIVAGAAARGDQGATASRRWQALGIPVLADSWSQSNRLNTYLLAAAEEVEPLSSGALGTRGFVSRRQVIDLSTRQLVSGLAHRHTPGIGSLLEARQARGLAQLLPRRDRVTLLDDLRRSRSPVVLASAQNQLPPGLALHAELLALHDQGLAGDQVLKAAGRNAAALLGLAGKIGEISVGARADLVLVDGDPLANPRDARKIVGVVRNGRFYSLVNLLERRSGSVE